MAADVNDVHEFTRLICMIYIRSTQYSEGSAALLIWNLKNIIEKKQLMFHSLRLCILKESQHLK